MSKTALITGSAKRIGLDMATFLANKGYNIALHCNQSKELARDEAQKICSLGVKCEVFACDLSNPNNISQLFSSVTEVFNTIDLLINNASIFRESSIKNTSIEDMMTNFSIHFFSPVLLCQKFAEQKGIKDGIIVNILDKNIARNQTKYFSYLHSKKALYELTKYLAIQLAPNIRTNSISPGFILEEDGIIADESYTKKKLEGIPLKQKGSPENILQALEYILSNKYVNGQNLFVDGGSFLLR